MSEVSSTGESDADTGARHFTSMPHLPLNPLKCRGCHRSTPTIYANWQASGGERWTVPVSLGIGQLMKWGRQSLSLEATAVYNVVAPAGSATWTLEMEVQLLFPK